MKPVTFRLYPKDGYRAKRSSLYVRVNIWPTRTAFDTYARSLKYYHTERVGFIVTRDDAGNECAEVNLYVGYLKHKIVVHELCHAAVEWMRRMKVSLMAIEVSDHDTASPEEERLCYALGSLTQQFWDRARKPTGS
jgi:hypothetical protein